MCLSTYICTLLNPVHLHAYVVTRGARFQTRSEPTRLHLVKFKRVRVEFVRTTRTSASSETLERPPKSNACMCVCVCVCVCVVCVCVCVVCIQVQCLHIHIHTYIHICLECRQSDEGSDRIIAKF